MDSFKFLAMKYLQPLVNIVKDAKLPDGWEDHIKNRNVPMLTSIINAGGQRSLVSMSTDVGMRFKTFQAHKAKMTFCDEVQKLHDEPEKGLIDIGSYIASYQAANVIVIKIPNSKSALSIAGYKREWEQTCAKMGWGEAMDEATKWMEEVAPATKKRRGQ